MFLKRLETVGFKSFAERIQVEFVPGVTAVVGPNGSGKSNIIYAIRWVLGEQSARSLRGKKMEDIIFQGSDTRNPLNFAEVSLILNNADEELPIDYHEVNITRRVYRSGESEFFINKQACRLKDIVDLFMDTGLGRESFSIIGQGKIDEILSSKAEERRVIFEEAAGVLKYKHRKNEAQFKLTETEDNLVRVEDIIHEIKQQIEPLKKQAEIAKMYKEKKKDLKNVEVSLLVTEIEQLHSEWKQLLKKIEEDKLEEIKKKTIIQQREAQNVKNRESIQELDKQITTLQDELVHLTEQLEQYEGKRNVLKERLKHLQANKKKLLQDKQLKGERIEQVKQFIQIEQTKLEAVHDKINELTNEKEQIEIELYHGLDTIKEELENKKSDYIDYLNEQAACQNELQMIARQVEQLESRSKNESTYYEEMVQQEAKLSKLHEQLTETITTLTKDILEKENNLRDAKELVHFEKKQLESMQEKLYEGNEQIAKLSSRIEMLEEMKDNFQGFFYGVKEILQAKKTNRLQNIYGAVVDLIHVPTEYMTAIDTILGAQAQYVVVPNDEVARHVIHWLKNENKGRATFLPLQSIEARTISHSTIQQIKQQKGYIGIASDLIQIEEKFEKVAQHLMGNVIVTKSLADANAIAQMTNRRYRVVTLEGDIVFPGGSMSGGAKRKANQSLFTREKELKLLTEKIQRSLKRRDEFVAEMNEKREKISGLDKKITVAEKELHHLENSLKKKQVEHNEIVINLHSITEELKTFQLSKRQQNDDYIHLQEEEKRVQKKLETITSKIKNTDAAINQLTKKQQTLQQNEQNAQKRLHELQIFIAEQEERTKSHQERINTLHTQLNELEEEYATIVDQINELLELEQSSNLEQELEEKILECKEERQKTVQMIENKQEKRKQKNTHIDDEEREIRQLYKLHENFVREIQEKEVQANRLDVTLENHLSFLQKEYMITYEKAAQQFERVDNIDKAKEHVDEIKQSMKQLGTVNLGSIEEYERLQERYTFLTEQQQDLVQAKQTLYEVIKEMDQEMTERFMNMFKEIQSSFSTVFKQLFGGGHAELSLTEPDNILETGIEIVARPPGKKLRTLGLLSGGEKALTAIALLFAILRARPVPFCILDEVDATLDEANVIRFGNYLKTFSNETQFVVITHRKGTMEEADALYGVTMQESGVSRLVSVRLEDTSDLVEAN